MNKGARSIAIAGADVTELAGALDTTRPSYQAYRILHFGFTVAPVLMGLDKFFNLLVDWERYLPPGITQLLGGNGHLFLMAVGVIEVVAGIGVALRPRIFSYVVAAWLWAIIVNLLLIPGYFDIAVRDFGLSLGALALGRLSAEYGGR